MKKVGIIMGSDSDLPVVEKAIAALEKYGVDKVVYGHIHAFCKQNLILQKHGVEYFLTSCDIVGNKLIEICWKKKKI